MRRPTFHHIATGPGGSTRRRTAPAVLTLALVVGGTGAVSVAASPAGAARTPATGGSATGTGSGTAAGCGATALAAAQGTLESNLNARLTELGTLSDEVQASTTLTPSDRSQVTATLSTTTAAMQALLQKAPADATCAQVAADGRTMVQQYRVFVVVAPQTHLDLAADAAGQVESTLVANEAVVQAAITRAGQAGRSTTAAQAAFADLEAKVAAAQAATGGVAATVLAQTPASYPASSAVFTNARAGLQTGYADLKAAAADLRTVVADLR